MRNSETLVEIPMMSQGCSASCDDSGIVEANKLFGIGPN